MEANALSEKQYRDKIVSIKKQQAADEASRGKARAAAGKYRADAAKEIQKITAEEVPFLFIMFPTWFNHFNTRVQGLPESALIGDLIYAKAYTFWKSE